MKSRLIKIITLTIGLVASSFSYADWELKGELTLIYPTGQTKKIDMPMAYTSSEYEHKFRVGKYEYSVTGQPERYSFALVLQKSNYMWVQEFSKGYFQSFEWNIQGHKLRLYKEVFDNPVVGDYVLNIDGVDYFFKTNLGQLNFKFDDDGIKEIEVDGMITSLGNKQSKGECDPEQEDCDKEN